MSESGTSWRKADADAIRRHHAPLFEAWKRDWGHRRRDRNEWIPGFRGSLQSLLDQGYTAADISVFLGISRERVRQYIDSYDLVRIAGSVTMRRVWDDELMRFRPVTPSERHAEEARQRRVQRERERERRSELVRHIIRSVAAKHGRTPTTTEVGRMLNPQHVNPPALARSYLGCGPAGVRALDRAFLDCGFVRPNIAEAARIRHRAHLPVRRQAVP